ncbi:MAG: hypothetical protein JSW34_09925 [Candidatus Zixiibacteriota bacterium]|nr:MAG: hypothetical protein JSW34_09925 [candidate division Zixibacteria bacterium]
MKIRVTIIGAIVLALAAVSPWAAEDVKKEQTDSTAVESKTADQDSTRIDEPAAAPPRLIAYYFHTTRRCATCKKLEAYTREAIETGFAEQLKSGVLSFLAVNIDESDNEHFRKDYQLYTKSVILSERKDGEEVKWKNLDQIWQLVRGDKAVYLQYIQDEVTAALGEG